VLGVAAEHWWSSAASSFSPAASASVAAAAAEAEAIAAMSSGVDVTARGDGTVVRIDPKLRLKS
jgi:hypothetical protein